MKISTLLLTVLFLFAFQLAHSQKPEGIHSFKIIGKNRMPVFTEIGGGFPVQKKIAGEMSVEYDTTSPNHLIISKFGNDGFLKIKMQLLFKGEKFNLATLDEHINKGELLVDGIQTDYREDETVASELLYKEEKLQKQTFFYPNGKMQMAFSGDERTLNGEYRMWHPNGQLSFSGTYLKNLKNGEFQQFDQSGVLVRKGLYMDGKLVSGDAVVQDLTYENPEQLAQFTGGDQAFNEYLKLKSANFDLLKVLGDDMFRDVNLKLTINKTGNIRNIEILSEENTSNHEIINSVFAGFPGFKPALVEDVPVTSKLNLNLILTKEGWQTKLVTEVSQMLATEDSSDNIHYSDVEEMPEFPGGDNELFKFLAKTVRYPVEAMENGFQGKAFISFVVEKDGSITNVTVNKGVHPLLNAEGVRVVKGMPRWIPGRQSGKTVRVSYTIPINFVLE